MTIEHTTMKHIMRIASAARRKLPKPPHSPKGCCHRGYGFMLELLAGHDGLSQSEIAEGLKIRPQSASEAISNMEKQGLVYKETNPQDRRGFLVFITPEGKKTQEEIQKNQIRNAQRIFAALDEKEKAVLEKLLKKVVTALDENKEEE